MISAWENEYKCKNCGKKFKVNEKGQNARKYCSRECASQSRKERENKRRKRNKERKYITTDTSVVDVKIFFPDWVEKTRRG